MQRLQSAERNKKGWWWGWRCGGGGGGCSILQRLSRVKKKKHSALPFNMPALCGMPSQSMEYANCEWRIPRVPFHRSHRRPMLAREHLAGECRSSALTRSHSLNSFFFKLTMAKCHYHLYHTVPWGGILTDYVLTFTKSTTSNSY